ncbi:winged helix-turn-helix domain-containing protein [Halosegnis marinus]|uniref:Helix-turn-helix domain-containing protein n=1 Tax=Halosegnis marinus TaxID=3034023 RepID=A0ABD5ZRA4_9EURY|nr:helix-turn-helix domain-containing protein [Halosegnis sp. DT85]
MSDAPDTGTVLDALDDPDARTILERLEEPMSAAEVAEACDIARSTAYRKLGRLSEASLLAEETRVRADGHHTTRYRVAFESVVVEFSERRTLGVEVVRPDAPDAQLASMWAEVRREV